MAFRSRQQNPRESDGPIVWRDRLGGLLTLYERKAACLYADQGLGQHGWIGRVSGRAFRGRSKGLPTDTGRSPERIRLSGVATLNGF